MKGFARMLSHRNQGCGIMSENHVNVRPKVMVSCIDHRLGVISIATMSVYTSY